MADGTATVTMRGDGWRAITRYQWLVFVVVWLGWTLDAAADFGLLLASAAAGASQFAGVCRGRGAAA